MSQSTQKSPAFPPPPRRRRLPEETAPFLSPRSNGRSVSPRGMDYSDEDSPVSRKSPPRRSSRIQKRSPLLAMVQKSPENSRLDSLRQQIAILERQITPALPVDTNPGRAYSNRPQWSNELCDLIIMEADSYAGETVRWETIRASHPELQVWSGQQLKDKYRNLTQQTVGSRRKPTGTRALAIALHYF